MDRQEILKSLHRFPYDRRGYWVITGAAMVLYGIREQTADIDLGCTGETADRLEADGFLYRRTDGGRRWFRYGESIEVFEGWLRGTVETVEGFSVISLDGLVEMKTELGREKDIRDIERIKAFAERSGSRLQGDRGAEFRGDSVPGSKDR